MQFNEFLALQKVEREHWFYRGKRALVRWWIAGEYGPITSETIIIDAGAGTGELVRELRAHANGGTVIGVEYAEEARELAKKYTNIDLLPGSILDLPFPENYCDVIVASDVLEHVADDRKALAELIRVTKPGGLVIVNVPAFQILWSNWDVTLGHHRRYLRQQVEELIRPHKKANLVKTIYLNYINVLIFPAALLYRLISRVVKFGARAEDKIPSKPLNNFLYSNFLRTAKKRNFSAPFGLSVFAVLRKT